jgi:hypothetical protein
MSQTPRLRRARQLTASLLTARPAADGYENLVSGRLQKLEAAGGTGMLPFPGNEDGALYFRNGRVVYAESPRTPAVISDPYSSNGDELPPLGKITAIRTVTEPILDAVLELFTTQVRYGRFRPSRLPDAAFGPGLTVQELLTEIARRQRLMKQLSVVLTPDTAIARNPHLRTDAIRISAWQWALLIRVGQGSTPRELALGLTRSVFGTTIDVYKLLVMRLLSTPGEVPQRGLAVMSFVRAASAKKGDTMPVISAATTAGGGA